MLTVTVDRNRISETYKATVTVVSDTAFTAIEARATEVGASYGRSIGYDLLADDNSAESGVVTLGEAVTEYSFDVESSELYYADGDYRISVYVMNESGVWSDCCLLYTSSGEAVIDSNGAAVLVKRAGTGTDERYTSAYSGADIDNFISEVLQ